jgi:hypothetical protein
MSCRRRYRLVGSALMSLALLARAAVIDCLPRWRQAREFQADALGMLQNVVLDSQMP